MGDFLNSLKENRKKIEEYATKAQGQEKDKAEAALAQMRSGKGIAAIGALCPLLWMSIISGQSLGAIAFNFCHSMIYVAIGLFMYFSAVKKGLKQIDKQKKKRR